MKVQALTLAGFGPFREAQHIDFSVFERDGIFLISGKTGAGKSSILDGICFALYGGVPRYQGSEHRLRSDHARPDEPTFVTLEFELHESRYRIHRVPAYERLAKRGDKLVEQKPEATLEIYEDGTWTGLAAGPKDVGIKIYELLQLTERQFLQVILLAQNSFQDFLLAKNEDRQAVLRSLFHTQRYQDIEAHFAQQRRVLGEQVHEIRQRVQLAANQLQEFAGVEAGAELGPQELSVEWFEEFNVQVDADLDAYQQLLLSAEKDVEQATKAYQEAQSRHDRWQRKADAQLELDELQLQDEQMQVIQCRLEAGRRSSLVRPSADQLTMRMRSLTEITKQLQLYSEKLAPFQHSRLYYGVQLQGLGADGQGLEQTLQALQDRLGHVRTLVTAGDKLAALQGEESEAAKKIEQLVADVQNFTTAANAIPQQLKDLRKQLDTDRVLAETTTQVQATEGRVQDQLAAALRLEDLIAQRQEAEAGLKLAAAEQTKAANLVETLTQQRFAHMGAELAERLQPGVSCPVCGSTEHPAPAQPETALVSAEDIAEAQQSLQAATRRYEKFDTRHGEIEVKIASEKATTQGQTVATLKTQLQQAQDELKQVQAAAQRVQDAQRAIANLETQQQELTQQNEAKSAELTDARVASATRQAQISELVQRLDLGQQPGETVADVAAALETGIATLNGFREKQRAQQTAQKELQIAAEQLNSALAEHGFADEADFRAALLDEAEVTKLDKQIQEHREAVAAWRQVLAAPDLQGLPADQVNLEVFKAALDSANQDRQLQQTRVDQTVQRQQHIASVVRQGKTGLRELEKVELEFEQVQILANSFAGLEPNTKRMRLETYVLAAQLEEIIDAANTRLTEMTSGRYRLYHDDSIQYRKTQSGLGVQVLDTYSQQLRPPQSLSGGETFLASLALALGLAEVVSNQAGGIKLDTLFIDEGFGSLDDATLNIAMGTIDSLRHAGRCVGLISHVAAMKEQIPTQLKVHSKPSGDSYITQQVMD